MQILIVWLVTAIIVMAGAYIIPGVSVSSFPVALVVAIVLGLINITIKPLILLITLPINILTLGIFTFVINALMILLAARIVDGFTVDTFWAALLFALLISILNALVIKD